MKLTKLKAKAILMGRYGMLDCANNFQNGYKSKLCDACNKTDDENHRINECIKWKISNPVTLNEIFDYEKIYSNDIEDLEFASDIVLNKWDLKNGRNCMVKD